MEICEEMEKEKSIEMKINTLLGEMTLHEKIGQMVQKGSGNGCEMDFCSYGGHCQGSKVGKNS